MITPHADSEKNPLLRWILSEQAVLAVSLLAVFASFWSKFLISLSIFLFVILAVPHIIQKTREIIPHKKWPLLVVLSMPFRDIVSCLLMVIFIGTAMSALFSETTQDISKVQLRLPYLLLPFAFYFLPGLSKSTVRTFLKIFIPMALLFAIGVLVNYFQDMEHYDELIAIGQSMPVPGNHIRFSLLLAAAVAFGTIALTESLTQFRSREGYLITGMTIAIFCFLHIIAVRSGLLTMYGALFLIFARYFYQKKKKWQVAGVVVGMSLLLWLAVQFIPSLGARFQYMVHDIKLLTEKDVGHYSDGDRFRSIYVGWRVFLDHPVWGSDIADLPQAMDREYNEVYGRSVPVHIPHNQFVYILASMGIFGMLSIFPGLLIPLFIKHLRKNAFIIIHSAMFLASCMIEPTMEGTQGIMFHLLFLLFFIKFAENKLKSIHHTGLNT